MVHRRRVIIESPYAGDIDRNLTYARRCLLDSLQREEAPFASHLLYIQVLDDTDPIQRRWGMEAGFIWHKGACASVVYTDYGVSSGMRVGIQAAEELGLKVEYRTIGENP